MRSGIINIRGVALQICTIQSGAKFSPADRTGVSLGAFIPILEAVLMEKMAAKRQRLDHLPILEIVQADRACDIKSLTKLRSRNPRCLLIEEHAFAESLIC